MNKTKWITPGGIPLRNENWKFDNDALRDALKGLASMLGGNFYLSGIVFGFPPNSLSWTAGYIVMNGEVLFVPAGSTAFDNVANAGFANTYFELQTGEDPEGLCVLENGSQANLFETRIGKIVCYGSAQPENATRVSVITVFANSIENFVLERVLNRFNKFTKAQNWREDSNPQSTVGTGVITLNADCNSYRVSITTGQTNGVGQFHNSAVFQDGMIVTLNLEGTNDDVFFVGDSANNIRTGYGQAVVFYAGVSIQFIKSNGIWKLLSSPYILPA